MLSICAVIAVHNGARTLPRVLAHLESNRISVHIIDHGSTDSTPSIITRYKGAPVTGVTLYEYDGVYRLRQQLELKESILETVAAEWIVHVDADEILESPNEGETLREMIERHDQEGFDVIDCDEFVFTPVEDALEPQDFIKEMCHYYYFSPVGRTLHRVQRRANAQWTWSESGGHTLSMDGRKLASERIRLRHYIGLSFDHLRSQYLGRVFASEELQRGWHQKRVPTTKEFIVKPDASRLMNLAIDGWRRENPEQSHLIFHQPQGYKIPEQLYASDLYRPFPFIVGVGRSETTLLHLMIDAHPEIAITSETHWLREAVRKLLADPIDCVGLRTAILSDPGWTDIGISLDDLDNIVAMHSSERPGDTLRRIYQRYGHRNAVARVGDKTPLHSSAMHEIATILPEARFIHIIRDGRDVALSDRDLWFGPGHDVKTAAISWMWHIREMRQQAQFVPHYLEIRYEALVTDPEKVLKSIAHFIDLPFHPLQLTAYRQTPECVEGPRDAVRDGCIAVTAGKRRDNFKLCSASPDPSRIGCWASQMDPADLATFERVAGNMLTDLGYAHAITD
jgi:hypothetical protein